MLQEYHVTLLYLSTYIKKDKINFDFLQISHVSDSPNKIRMKIFPKNWFQC